MNNDPLSPGISLPPSVHSLYHRMSREGKELFNKVFMLMWSKLLPHARKHGVLYSYYALDLIRREYRLTNEDLSLLTYLYMITDRGKTVINSQHLRVIHPFNYNWQVMCNHLVEFKNRGYIVRLSRDPSQPYLSRFISRQKIYIQLTGKSVNLIESMEKELYRRVVNCSLADLTKLNIKGQAIA